MKIRYKPVGGSYVTLFDEAAGDVVETFTPSFSSINQVTPLLGPVANQFSENRGNVRCSMSLAGNVTYADLSSALGSILTHSALLTGKYHFEVSQGTVTHYYPNALIDSYAPRIIGQSVAHQLTFSSDKVTASAP